MRHCSKNLRVQIINFCCLGWFDDQFVNYHLFRCIAVISDDSTRKKRQEEEEQEEQEDNNDEDEEKNE